MKLFGENNPKAMVVWEEIKEGKGRLVVSSVVIAEMTKKLLKMGKKRQLGEFLEGLEESTRIFVVDLTSKLALEAGKLGNTYDMPTVDSIILATAISTGHTNVLTDDNDFLPAAKQNKVKIVKF